LSRDDGPGSWSFGREVAKQELRDQDYNDYDYGNDAEDIA
jgi:hypothetical protein